jgi:hypothetical protein
MGSTRVDYPVTHPEWGLLRHCESFPLREVVEIFIFYYKCRFNEEQVSSINL